jgi:acetoin utilization deacetylase AcuC-like enzyme
MDELILFYPSGHQGHYKQGHPERPERVEVIWDALQKAAWWERAVQVGPFEVPEQVLHSVHASAYLNLLKQSGSEGRNAAWHFADLLVIMPCVDKGWVFAC